VHLYVHVPFCARRCSYCDFAIAVRRSVPSARFVDAILREWSWWQDDPTTRVPLDTLYFGGGTPSHLDPAELARLVAGLRGGSTPRETTLETNPDDVTPERARAWVAAGIDRVSLGVQSFDPAVLEWMHRTHRAEQVAPAVAALRAAGIRSISLDLIYALPPDLRRDWGGDLDRALALAPEHLSLYGLTVEPHTALGRWVERRESRMADDDRYAGEFLLAHERLTAAGFEHYEVSNYGRPGHRAVHNSAYWQRRPFLGLGPSAHSGMGERRWWNIREYAPWQVAVEGAESAAVVAAVEGESFPASVAGWEKLDAGRIRIEDLYLGLRTSDGLAADRLPTDILQGWVRAGWADVLGPPDRPTARLTAEGWLRLDALVGQVA
jgi:oxygen-independent coproporphyrinogen-3 oxidase